MTWIHWSLGLYSWWNNNKKDNRSDKQEPMSVINSGPNSSFHNQTWILKTIKNHVIDHGIKWKNKWTIFHTQKLLRAITWREICW